jgi:hypothetical protein
MRMVALLNSCAGRVFKVVLGAWLLIEGALLVTLGGLVMMTAGVVLVATAVAGVCLVGEAVTAWRGRHAPPPPARPREHQA